MAPHLLPNGLPLADGTTIPWHEIMPGMYHLAAVRSEPMVVAYARTAMRYQAADGGHLRQQVELALELAAEHGEQVAAVYVDPGVSAVKTRSQDRAGLSQLLEDIRSEKVRMLYAHKRDRLCRSWKDWKVFLEAIGQHGVQVIWTSKDEPAIGDPVLGRLTEAMLSAIQSFGLCEGAESGTGESNQGQVPTA